MARGRAAWKRKFDLKPALGRFFAGLERDHPGVTRALRYYSLAYDVPASECFDHFTRPLLLDKGEYAEAWQALQIDNVDGYYEDNDFDGVRFDAGLLRDHFVVGHVLRPIDRATGKMATMDGLPVPWGLTFPSLSSRPERHIAGTAVAIPRMTNFYHLVVDHLLPVVAAVVRNPERFSDGVTFVVNGDYQAIDLFAGILSDFGVATTVLKVAPADTVSADAFLWARSWGNSTEHGYVFAEELKTLGPLIDKRIADIRTPAKIVVPRSKTRIRNLVNQDDMLADLKARGFEPFELKWSNLLGQVAAFRRAEAVVSVHGAALTNLAWGTGGRVVEIFPDNARKTPFLHIASQNSWRYAYVFGGREQDQQNFSVDIDALAVAL